jgi:hypothetical protein
MWLCKQQPAKPIPPKLWDRFKLPSYLKEQINNANKFRDDLEPGGDDPEDRTRKQFNLDTKCDVPDDWSLGDDALPLDLQWAPMELNKLQKGE